MAIIKVVAIKNSYKSNDTYVNVINYAINPEKVRHGYIALGGVSSPQCAATEMEQLAEKHKNNRGKRVRHTIIDFSVNDEIDPFEAYRIAEELIEYYEDDYQILAAVHENEVTPHIHIIMNTVRKWDGKKYEGKKKDYYGFIKYSKSVLYPYNVRLKTVK